MKTLEVYEYLKFNMDRRVHTGIYFETRHDAETYIKTIGTPGYDSISHHTITIFGNVKEAVEDHYYREHSRILAKLTAAERNLLGLE